MEVIVEHVFKLLSDRIFIWQSMPFHLVFSSFFDLFLTSKTKEMTLNSIDEISMVEKIKLNISLNKRKDKWWWNMFACKRKMKIFLRHALKHASRKRQCSSNDLAYHHRSLMINRMSGSIFNDLPRRILAQLRASISTIF